MAAGDKILLKLAPKAAELGFESVEAMIRHFYLDKEQSSFTIGLRLGVSDWAIFNLLKRFGIETRPPAKNNKAWKRSMGYYIGG